VDLIGRAVQLVLQELIETEVTEQIGAVRYERAETRITGPNGSRRLAWLRRTLVTSSCASRSCARAASSPSILEPRRRIDQALYALVMEA
jgi:putative transposase